MAVVEEDQSGAKVVDDEDDQVRNALKELKRERNGARWRNDDQLSDDEWIEEKYINRKQGKGGQLLVLVLETKARRKVLVWIERS